MRQGTGSNVHPFGPPLAELTKNKLRSTMLLRLKTQKEEDRERKSRSIKAKLFRTEVFKKAKTVMFYVAFDGEVETREMIKAAQELGKRIAVPLCKQDRSMVPGLFWEGVPLKRGPYGVSEPAVERRVNLRDIDLVIVPGVAFDKRGRRLGRGKGCYDWFLKKIPKRTTSIGLAFDFQVLPYIPAIETDVDVHRVIFA